MTNIRKEIDVDTGEETLISSDNYKWGMREDVIKTEVETHKYNKELIKNAVKAMAYAVDIPPGTWDILPDVSKKRYYKMFTEAIPVYEQDKLTMRNESKNLNKDKDSSENE